MLTITEAAHYLGLSISTLHRWDRVGYLPSMRTLGNHQRYTIDHLDSLSLIPNCNDEEKPLIPSKIRIPHIYARVSTEKAKPILKDSAEFLLSDEFNIELTPIQTIWEVPTKYSVQQVRIFIYEGDH